MGNVGRVPRGGAGTVRVQGLTQQRDRGKRLSVVAIYQLKSFQNGQMVSTGVFVPGSIYVWKWNCKVVGQVNDQLSKTIPACFPNRLSP